MISKRLFLLFVIAGFLSFRFSHALPDDKPKIKKVVIDAGHGGKDPGALGFTKYYEKKVALAIALKLGAKIKAKYKDVEVIYTRSTDVFIPLHERAKIANDAKADLFISIHADAAENKAAQGTETWVLGLHRAASNLEMVKRENKVVLLEDSYQSNYEGFTPDKGIDPNSVEAQIIMEMHQNQYLEQSLNLAAKVQKNMKSAGRIDRGVKQAGFVVLYKTYMPSILVETGFVSNKEEEVFLKNDDNRELLANSIFKAFIEYKEEFEGVNNDTVKVKKVTPVEKIDTIEEKQDQEIKQDTPSNKSELIFGVQFMVSKEEMSLKSKKFKNLDSVWQYKTGSFYKYVSGQYNHPDKASENQAKLRELGFKDAFVVSFHKGERIPYNDALKLLQN